MPRGDRPQAGIVPVPAPGDLTLDAWRPISAAHEQVISPRNFFRVAPPPRGLASSRPRARSRLAFSPSRPAALSLISFRGFGLAHSSSARRSQGFSSMSAADGSAKTKIGVLGASGYTGAELLRLLLCHPKAQIVLLTAERRAGKTMAEVFA